MRKVGIVTLKGYFNYGNRLQNYALQEVLKSMGFEVETIIYEDLVNKKANTSVDFLERISIQMKKSPVDEFNKYKFNKWARINQEEIEESKKARTNIFKKFSIDYLNETDFSISDTMEIEGLSDKYDYFITGSDQVWNPNFTYGSPIFFLTFAEKHKRIAYAPSFGVSEIKKQYREDFKKHLLDMHRLSVREDEGAKLIKDLTGRDAPVLVDPTLLLDRDKWLSISNQANNRPNGEYLLTYFLGSPDVYRKQINNLAHRNGLERISLGGLREKESYMTGPSEFIDYLDTCSLICTDSFHGAVFSILMRKPFIVYKRRNSGSFMSSRLDTLLNRFGLVSRRFENIKTNDDVFNIDYTHVPSILKEERDKALSYLRETLNVEESLGKNVD